MGFVAIMSLLVITLSTGHGRNAHHCDIQSCFNIYNNLQALLSRADDIDSDLNEFLGHPSFENGEKISAGHLECFLRRNLAHCMKRKKRCHGDLNYHFLDTMIKRLRENDFRENCGAAAMRHLYHDHGSRGETDRSSSPIVGEEPILPSLKYKILLNTPDRGLGPGLRVGGGDDHGGHQSLNSEQIDSGADYDGMRLSKAGGNYLRSSSEEDEEDDDGRNLGIEGGNKGGGDVNKCVPKLVHSHHSKVVGCALYGLTNLKSFHDPLNFTDFRHCSLTGSWSLIDTPEFAVQITNNEGYPPMPENVTMTTLVTVILKRNDCSQLRMYKATFDEVPRMFTDGSSAAGTVQIETLIPSEHVRINMHYLQASIDIVKVVGHLPIPSLSIIIRMSQVNLTNLAHHPSKISGFPLCFYGCPNVASLLATKARSVPSYKCAPPKKSRSSSVEDEIGSEELSTALAQRVEESLDTSTSINAVICDSLLTVQKILGDKIVVLKERVSFPGEDTNNYAIMNDQSSCQQSRSIFIDEFCRLILLLIVSKVALSQFQYLANNLNVV